MRFSRSTEKAEAVLRCAERLHEAAIGETVTHDQLKLTIGRQRSEHYYSIVRAARTKLNRESGIVFVADRGSGYTRLGSAEGVAASGEIGLKKIRKTTNRDGEQLENAVHHANSLSPAEGRTAAQTLATFGLLNHLARKKTVAKVPVDEDTKPDSLADLKKIFGL